MHADAGHSYCDEVAITLSRAERNVLWQGSIVVMLLAGVVFVGTLLTASFGGRAAVHDIMTGQNLHFSSFCQVLLGGQQ